MSFSIIIPSRNPENLKACIAAIRASGCDARIIVIDDSDDAEVACVTLDDNGTLCYRGISPFVFSQNVNIGVEKAEADDVVIMNDDALVQKLEMPVKKIPDNINVDTLTLLEYAARRGCGHFGIVSAAVEGAHKAHELDQISYPHLCELHPNADLLTVREVKAPMVPFICVYIPRSTIDRVGLLEERFTDYGGEDNDYCRRVREAGLKIGVYDGCVVDHGTLPSTFRPDGKGRDVSIAKRQYVEKWGDANGW